MYFANFEAVKKVTEDESSKYTVIVIGDLPSGQSLKSKVIHHPLRSAEELDSAQFEAVAGSISEAVRDSGHVTRGSGHVIVTSVGDPGLAISLVIPHLVIQHNMGVGEAARHIERLRPGLALPAPVLVKMEDWWSSRGQQSRDGRPIRADVPIRQDEELVTLSCLLRLPADPVNLLPEVGGEG